MKTKKWYSVKDWKSIPPVLYPVALCILILTIIGVVSADMKFSRR